MGGTVDFIQSIREVRVDEKFYPLKMSDHLPVQS